MKHRTIQLLVLALLLTACASSKSAKSGSALPPSPQVPPAPPLNPQPIDLSLRNAARGELLAECAAPDPFLRCNAIEALSDVDPADAAGAITRGLDELEPSVRFASALSAGQIRLKAAYPKLLTMANDDDLRVQAAVRFALHRLGDTRLSHDLEKLAGNPDFKVRASTAQVLGLLGEPSATNILVTLMSDPSAPVRIQAAEALWLLGDQRGLEALLAYAISVFPDDQIIALHALAEPRNLRAAQELRSELTEVYPEVSLAAARGLGMLGSDEGWHVAITGAKSVEPRQRSLAALAMGAIGRCDLQPPLATLLKDPDPSVRISAATAVLQLHQPSQVAHD
jgi:HEAT repeat protein